MYVTKDKRNQGRQLKRLLDVLDRNGSNGDPTACQLNDDNNYYDDDVMIMMIMMMTCQHIK